MAAVTDIWGTLNEDNVCEFIPSGHAIDTLEEISNRLLSRMRHGGVLKSIMHNPLFMVGMHRRYRLICYFFPSKTTRPPRSMEPAHFQKTISIIYILHITISCKSRLRLWYVVVLVDMAFWMKLRTALAWREMRLEISMTLYHNGPSSI